MKIELKSHYSPVMFFSKLEKYMDSKTPLEIIFPDDCTDAFSTIFNLNSLNNVENIEVPWNFGAADIMEPSCKASKINDNESVLNNFCYSLKFIYLNNLKLLDIAARDIIEKNEFYIAENLPYANNFLRTVLTLPMPKSLKKITFRNAPENQKSIFKYEDGKIVSFDGKFTYKKL